MKYRTLNRIFDVYNEQEIDGKTNLARRATAPATTGDATLVPDKTLQPDTRFEPLTSEPYVTKSGFIRP
jgi:hypothetical protein